MAGAPRNPNVIDTYMQGLERNQLLRAMKDGEAHYKRKRKYIPKQETAEEPQPSGANNQAQSLTSIVNRDMQTMVKDLNEELKQIYKR